MAKQTSQLLEQTLTQTEAEAGALDAVLEATQKRQQNIRATAAQFLGVPPDKVCALLRNVWRTSKGEPELTDNEMFQGMSMIARFGLDPIAKEVYVTRGSKGLMTIIGIDGFIKILDRTEGYDGFETNLGWSDDGKSLDWVEVTIYSTKRSHPTTYRGFAAEYSKISGVVAKSIPWHMLRLFALRHAVRLFTPLGGSVVTEEEARWMDAYDDRKDTTTAKQRLDALANRLRGKSGDAPDVYKEDTTAARIDSHNADETRPDGELTDEEKAEISRQEEAEAAGQKGGKKQKEIAP